MNCSDELASEETCARNLSTKGFYIGLALACGASVFHGSSFILTKKGLLRLTVRAGQGGYGYLKQWLWWAGLLCLGIGEAANFVAYAFAPATLVSPLGALSVLVSAVLSSYHLNEKLNLLGKFGCILCLVGTVNVIVNAPREMNVQSLDELVSKFKSPYFIVYIVLVVAFIGFLVFYAGPRWGQSTPLVYVTVFGATGSITVTGCKSLGIAIRQTVQGDSQLSNPAMWIIVATIVVCIVVQMIFMNRALDLFNTAVVTPLLYVTFTGFVVAASAILLNEWGGLGAEKIIGNLCGLVVIVVGITLVTTFRDLNISLRNLPRARKNIAGTSTTALENGDGVNGFDETEISTESLLSGGTVEDNHSEANLTIFGSKSSSPWKRFWPFR